MYALGFAACAFYCCVVTFCKHLKLAIDVIDAAADFTAENKRVILVPILYFFLTAIVFAGWCVCMTMIISLNKIEPGNYNVIP